MKKETLDQVKVIVLCIVVAFFLMMSMKANAQQQVHHEVDTVKYTYFDLKGRIVQPGFFAEKTLGWRRWFLAYDGIQTRKVWVDTIANK